MVTPSLATAVAVYNIYKLDTDLKLTRTMTSFVFAHTVMASLRETDRKLEYAATSLGAGRFATLRKVVFPSLSIPISAGFARRFPENEASKEEQTL